MKQTSNKVAIVTSFLVGLVGFLFLFKLIVLPYISPNDELAPGMVLILGVIAGLCFAFATKLILKKFRKRVL